MTTNETLRFKKEILSFNKKNLKGLNKLFYFDFNNEYSIGKLENGFTIKKIEKMIHDDINDYQIAILFKTNFYNSLDVAFIKNKKFSINVSRIYDCGLSRINTKKRI